MDDTESAPKPAKSWFERLSHLLIGEPQDRKELLEWLRNAAERQVLEPNALVMIEGVLQVSVMQVRDIMVPRSQMVVIEDGSALKDILPVVVASNHSRYPVVNKNHEDVLGVMLAKDLLAYAASDKEFSINTILRPAMFVPESKRLDILLQDFRGKRHHMAIVIDEYGSISGLVTIEDVLEQIVGEIEDEHDEKTDDDFIRAQNDNEFIVKAITSIEDFNEFFGSELQHDSFDTIGGLITNALGHIPRRGEQITIADRYQFKILHTDNRRVHLLHLRLLDQANQTTAVNE
jgi:magnesium and cobalt transporter